jgi:hypothetical protein
MIIAISIYIEFYFIGFFNLNRFTCTFKFIARSSFAKDNKIVVEIKNDFYLSAKEERAMNLNVQVNLLRLKNPIK